ncbi:MAG: ChaN family lipoprotein [Candidatus Melainabacteria bacterium]|nr:ChaN family lipoprotein [Candidatus Melainabacteria bacterium]
MNPEKLLVVVIFVFGLLVLTGKDFAGPDPESLSGCTFSTVEAVTDCLIARGCETIDYAAILDPSTRVLAFGEVHLSGAHRNELIATLPDLRKIGFNVLALEAMPASRQDLIRQYKEGSVKREDLKNQIDRIWQHSPESYIRLIDTALSLGMEVVFLDNDRERVDLAAANWQELQRQARDRREEYWIAVMREVLESRPGDKLIALIGEGHISPLAVTPPVQSRLTAKGIASETIAFEGGEMFYDSIITEAARHGNLQKKRFIVKRNKTEKTDVDYSLHLPQTEDVKKIILKRD